MNKIIKLGIAFFTITLLSCGTTPNDEEKRVTLFTLEEEYNACMTDAENKEICNTLTAQAICEYNGLNDLKENGMYIQYHKIYDFIQKEGSWKSLGFAPDQAIMTEVQEMVNQGYAVIAINTKDKHKFTVLIIKGELKKSGKWNADVPSCAAFFPASSSLGAFTNKTINYAWSKPDGIEFFVKR